MGSKISYFYFVKHRSAVNDLMLTLIDKPNSEWSSTEIELANIIPALNHIGEDNFAQSIKLIPPNQFFDLEEILEPYCR